MGFMHIENAYRYKDIFLFNEVYALEKIHGTSAHVKWDADRGLSHFAGGANRDNFVALFPDLAEKMRSLSIPQFIVYGEAYGGKLQAMSGTYGKAMKFVAFDVKIGDLWLDVPHAESIVKSLGLEFVDYEICRTDVESINAARDKPSVQAKRNGIEGDKMREGVVLRPLIELRKNNGERIICKHKNDAFKETKTPRNVSPDELAVLTEAEAIATEYCVQMRLEHVLGGMPSATNIKHTKGVIDAMLEDIKREAEGEIVWSKAVEKAIGREAARMFKQKISVLPVQS